MNFKYILAVLILVITLQVSAQKNNTYQADVIIYGGTSAAITAAVQVKKMGKSVIIVSPDKHLGGITSSGLGFTDTGNKAVIGGLSREFYQGIYNYYEKSETWKFQKKEEYGGKGQGTPAVDGDHKTMWIFEPNVAEKVFEDFISDNNITVYREEWLDRETGVSVQNGTIQSIKTLNGKTFNGTFFIDATYEGDLMAAAGVSFIVGREANSVYKEKRNGIQLGVFDHKHNFGKRKISPYVNPKDPKSGVIANVSTTNPGVKGQGDHKIQSYCFRMCLTQNEENRVAFQKPEGYDPSQYELLVRLYNDGWDETFGRFDAIPNLKTDVNNHGPFSSDYIGMNYDYPEATYERRQEIIKDHENYQKGWFYFIANDSRVPEHVRTEMSKWGLSKDEYKDNNNWPYLLYIREARRMIGEVVMTEHEILGKTKVNKPIGMGSYAMDSHNVQRYITKHGYVQNEGDIGEEEKHPYKIDLGAITPKKEECKNLLVPVAVSASHIAFGSIRMEPVFMILGQSAGLLSVMAMEENKNVSDIDYTKIRAKLIEAGQIIYNKD